MTFIQKHLNHYTVSQLCNALKFPRSTYYKALVRVSSNRQEEYEAFGRKVKQAYDDSRQRYGAVKICRTLNDNGTPCSVKRVQRHMAEQGLRSVLVKKYNHHVNHGAVPDDKANILKRDFAAKTINQKWYTVITYIHVLKKGWIYLAFVLDLCSRKIIRYAYGTFDDSRIGSRSGKECLPECQKHTGDHSPQRSGKPIHEPGI
ncbi:IS3 family transposase [Lachnospiraceae bacterium 45-W7]